MIFTEEVGLLIALARNPKVGMFRQELVREARLISKVILGMDNDMSLTNAAVDPLLLQGLIEKDDQKLLLTLDGARALLGLSRRLWMLSQLLGKTGALVDHTDASHPGGGGVSTNRKSFSQLLDENAALKLLLEEAHVYANHAWSCATVLQRSKVCDCWFGKTTEMLIADGEDGTNITVNLKGLVCSFCGHTAEWHAGTLQGSGVAVCCLCNCPCLGFKPKDVIKLV